MRGTGDVSARVVNRSLLDKAESAANRNGSRQQILLGGVSFFALLLSSAPIAAQEIIDNGEVSAPGLWQITDYLYVGDSGNGTLTIGPNAQVTAPTVRLGNQAGSSGTILVSGSNASLQSDSLRVGMAGHGTLTISNGGQVNTAVSSHIGSEAGSDGRVLVTGEGSRWNSGAVVVGRNGTGTLIIADGADVVSTATAWIGYGAKGEASVTGGGSTWSVSTLSIGRDAQGSLSIEGGGKLTSLGQAIIGEASSGALSVTGTASSWSANEVFVGLGGVGELSITSNGKVAASDFMIGVGAQGSVTVGQSSSLDSGYLSVGFNSAGSLAVRDGGSVAATELYLGEFAKGSGTLSLSGAGLTVSGPLLGVGVLGHGNLTVSNGASVTTGRDTALGIEAGSRGVVAVTGDGSRLTTSTMYIGQSGYGELTIGAGGLVSNVNTYMGNLAGSEGMATIAGENARWESSANMGVGVRGTGNLTVGTGGTVSNVNGYIGQYSGSNGTATVEGENARWENTNILHVGSQGSGTLRIGAGGTVMSAGSTIASSAASKGSVSVEGENARWLVSSNLLVGVGDGELQIGAGGLVSNYGGQIGLSSDSQGSVTVEGEGATWANSGNVVVGSGGTGALTIGTGGTVSNINAYVANMAGSRGDVTVQGENARWENDGNLNIGNFGDGTLTIADGGKVSNTIGSIGVGAGASGSVTVSGPGADWANRANLNVAGAGTAFLLIENGGTVSNTVGIVGHDTTANGTVTVTGAGSAWRNGSSLSVANFGTGALTVRDGGTVSNTIGYIGGIAGSHGTVDVNGAESEWNNSAALFVGTSGQGLLTVSDAGRVFAVETVVANESGSVGAIRLNGTEAGRGVLETGLVAEELGTGTLIFDGGILRATSDRPDFVSGFETGDVSIAEGGAFIDSNGHDIGLTVALQGAGGLTKLGDGTLTLTADNSYGGSTTIGAGELQIGSGGRSGWIGGNVVNDGTLTFNRSDDIVFNGGIDGTGQVVQRGSGRLELANTGNRYSGGTVVEQGILAGNTVSIRGDIRNNGAVEFLDLGPNVFSGDISGAGSVSIDGIGTLTLTGTNTFIGGLKIGIGKSVSVASDPNLGGAANVVTLDGGYLRATLSFDTDKSFNLASAGGIISTDANAMVSLDGALDGIGGLMKDGAGTLIVTGVSSYAGATFVDEGRLQIDGGGSIASSSSLTVRNGATLAGSGTVGDTTVELGGRIAPGSSIGTLTVVGDLTLSAGAWLDYEFGGSGSAGDPASGNSDRIVVNGDLSLNGNLNLLQSGDAADGQVGFGYYRLMTYTGTLSGAGLTIGSTPAMQEPAAYQIQAGPGRIDLFVGAAGDNTIQHWQGGNGTWGAGNTNWLNQGGPIPATWAGNTAIFKDAGSFAGGSIAVDGAQSFKGLQFVDEGYRLEGAGQLLVDGSTRTDGNAEIRVLADRAVIATEIAGRGGITKTEAGTLVLSGANSYSGGTRILGGAVEVTSAGNLGSTVGELVLDGGTLRTTASFGSARRTTIGSGHGAFDVGAGTMLALSGDISGPGDLVKQGAGTLMLAGDNTYAGARVEAGTLVGSSNSISGTVRNAGTVVFDQTADGSFAGNVFGLGSTDGEIIKRGSGTLTLSGTSVLDWTIEGGNLISSAERFMGDAEVGSDAIFTFYQLEDASYAGALTGAGGFVKDGEGILQLTGDSPAFGGHVVVAGGRLVVGGNQSDGKLGGSITVDDGGVLGGLGTIGGGTGSSVLVASGGIIAPGNSLGTMTIDGDLIFASGSRYQVEVASGGSASDLIAVTGSAILNGGSVVHIGMTGTYDPRSTYTVLTAEGGITGAFEGVTSDFVFLDPKLGYDGKSVTLTLDRNDIDFEDIGRTRNQRATATGVESLGFGEEIYDALVQFDEETARSAFDQLSGEVHASIRSGLIEDSHQLRDAMTDRLRSAFESVGAAATPVLAYGPGGPELAEASTDFVAAWSRAFGAWGQSDADGNASELERRTGGFLAGIDGQLAELWRMGLVVGYSHSSFDLDRLKASASSDNYHIGLYGGTRWGALALRSGIGYTWHEINSDRSIILPGLDDSLSADYDANTFQAFGELAYAMDKGRFAFEPFANLAYVKFDSDGFTEDGGAAALAGGDGSSDTTFTTIGLRASTAFNIGSTTATARGTIGWRHAFADTTPLATHAFAGGDTFTVAGTPIAENAALLELGVDFDIADTAKLGLTYQGQLASDSSQHGFSAKLNMRF